MDKAWYSGTIVKFDAASGQHRVLYDDGDSRWYDLSTKHWQPTWQYKGSVLNECLGFSDDAAHWRLCQIMAYDPVADKHTVQCDGEAVLRQLSLQAVQVKWLVNPQRQLFNVAPLPLDKVIRAFPRHHPFLDADLNSSWEWSYPAPPSQFSPAGEHDLAEPGPGWLAPHSVLWRRLVGRRIQAFWMGDVTFYPGTILRYFPPGKPHPTHIQLSQASVPEVDSHRILIIYDDGDRQVKSLTSLRFAWMQDQVDGPQRSPGVVGLLNMYNTCYLNAILQCLSHTAPLARFFTHGDAVWACINRSNDMGTGGRLAEAFAGLQKALWTRGHCSSVAPGWVKAVLADRDPTFNGMGQQDAHESLLQLLDGLHEDLAVKATLHPETASLSVAGSPAMSAAAAASPMRGDPTVTLPPAHPMFVTDAATSAAGPSAPSSSPAAAAGEGKDSKAGDEGAGEDAAITVSTSIIKRLFFVRTAELIEWEQAFTTDLDAASDGKLLGARSLDAGHVACGRGVSLEPATASSSSAKEPKKKRGWLAWMGLRRSKPGTGKVASDASMPMQGAGEDLPEPPDSQASGREAAAMQRLQLRLGPMGGELLPPIPVSYSVTAHHKTHVRRYKRNLDGPAPPPPPPPSERVSLEDPIGSPARKPAPSPLKQHGADDGRTGAAHPTVPASPAAGHKPGDEDATAPSPPPPRTQQEQVKWWNFMSRLRKGSKGGGGPPPPDPGGPPMDAPSRRPSGSSKASGSSTDASQASASLEGKPLNVAVGQQRNASSLQECLDAYFAPHSTFRQAPEEVVPKALAQKAATAGKAVDALVGSGSAGAAKQDPKRVWQLGLGQTKLLAPLPPVLLFQLKRFEIVPVDEYGNPTWNVVGDDDEAGGGGGGSRQAVSWVMRKLPHAVRFPLTGLDMSRYVATEAAVTKHRRPSQVRGMAHASQAVTGTVSGGVTSASSRDTGLSSPHAAPTTPPRGGQAAREAATSQPSALYDLYGIVCHEGSSTEGGHYVALVKVGGSQHLAGHGDPTDLVLAALHDLEGREALEQAVQALPGVDSGASVAQVAEQAMPSLLKQPPALLQTMPHGVTGDGADACWYMFDDVDVTPIDESYVRHKVVAGQAYLLFYARRS